MLLSRCATAGNWMRAACARASRDMCADEGRSSRVKTSDFRLNRKCTANQSTRKARATNVPGTADTQRRVLRSMKQSPRHPPVIPSASLSGQPDSWFQTCTGQQSPDSTAHSVVTWHMMLSACQHLWAVTVYTVPIIPTHATHALRVVWSRSAPY